MSIQVGWAGVGVIVAILLHAFFTVWWASKITNQIANLSASLDRLDRELGKRDLQIAASWERIDGLSQRVARIEERQKE